MGGARILVVEDEKLAAKHLQMSLSAMGFVVDRLVSTAEDALREVEEDVPDLILMDVMLGGEMDGIDAAKIIRSRFDVPVIYLTAYSDESLMKRAGETGPFGYLLKPFREEELFTTVEMALHKHRLEKESQARLEKLVEERTSELTRVNENLKQEITERTKAQEAVALAKEEWERTFDAVPDLVAIINLDYRITRMNKAMAQRLNLSLDELEETACYKVFHGADEPPPNCPYTLMLKDGLEHRMEVTEEVLGGTFLITVAPFRDNEGNLIGCAHIATDITEFKQQEEMLRQSERYKAVADLAAGVSHNFNNLLQIIVGGTELALSDLEVGNYKSIKESLEQILESSKFGAETVRRLQSFAGLRVDSRELMEEVFDVSNLVSQAVEMTKPWWKHAPEKDGKSISLIYKVNPGCLVRAKKDEIFDVLINLIKNAAEALPNGGDITIDTRVVEQSVILKVQDTGTGIGEEDLQRVFNPFYTDKAEAGRGLGLATSQRTIDLHGGQIKFESREGGGTICTVSLPLAEPETGLDLSENVGASDLKLNILVIDDMPHILNTLSKGLLRLKQTVHTALSGEEGIRSFKDNRPDVVICDLGMPEMNGWQVGKAIKAFCENEGFEKPIFILITGWAGQSGEKDMMAECGVDLCIEKPIDIRKLYAFIQRTRQKQLTYDS